MSAARGRRRQRRGQPIAVQASRSMTMVACKPAVDERPTLRPADDCSSLVELVRRRAAERPARNAFIFLRGGEIESGSLTFAELDAGARAMAARLQQHLGPGDRVLLSYPQGL